MRLRRQPSNSRRRLAVSRRPAGRSLLGAFSLLVVALAPAGPGRMSLVPTDSFDFGASIGATPGETTLAQFTTFTVSGFEIPVGTATIRLRGVVAGTVQVPVPAGTASTTGSFGPTDFAVPAGAAACGSDVVTVDGTSAQSTITVYCPTLTVTPNPVFSGGTATDLSVTGTGFAVSRNITLTLDGQNLPATDSDANGAITGVTIPGAALACGTHQLTATIQPIPIEIEVRRVALRAAADTVYPLPAVTTAISVLGCASSQPPPAIFAEPFETGIDQFTRFSVDGLDLAAGPATVKLGGVTAGTVTVGADGTFPTTEFTVPPGAATCGSDVVTIDDVTPAVAKDTIDVFCPTLTVTPNPVFSGGAAADLSVAGTGYPGDRPIDFAVDGQDLGTVTSDQNGAVQKALPGIALACGNHRITGTAQPLPETGGIIARAETARATVPFDPPIPATADVIVLGCSSSPTPPQINATPIETTLRQFTRFTVDGSLLPAGPATIRLRGVVAGTVQVDGKGTFPTTDLRVPAGAAACGKDAVTIDHGGAALAATSIAVYCPSITAAPNPVDSGGAAAVLNLSGTGFPPNRPVDLGFDGQNHATVTSDATGAIHGAIRGITPACGRHQTTATARPPAAAATGGAPAADFLPVSASAPVVVVGCARITANPDVIQQGMLTHVTGTGFLPRTAVTLTWQSPDGTVLASCSANAVNVPALTTDAAGRIDVFCLARPNQGIGDMLISALQSPERESAPVVVENGSMQPSEGNQLVFRR